MNKLFTATLAIALLATPMFAEVAEAASVTSQITHKVMRSDGTRANAGARNEFNGGSHLFFESLGDKTYVEKIGLKGDYTTVQKGWARLYLDWPTRLSSIVIHRASVGNGNFRHGHIMLEVQNLRGKWITVFERNDNDIDAPVTIRNELHNVGPIKGVRILFKSPLPITIGPIDLNG